MRNPSEPYVILPFRFIRTDNGKLLLVNEAGEFLLSDVDNFEKLIGFHLELDSNFYLDLKGKHFVTDTDIAPVIDLLATKYRSKKAFLKNFTALHMIVVTLRCNQKCRYCHASSEHFSNTKWDMTKPLARRVVDMIFMSPSPVIKIEFQGGEPLLNWDVVAEIIEYAEKLNRIRGKKLEFVLCTNLTLITEEILDYLKKHDVAISTSLDGPSHFHNQNRIFRKGSGTYDLFIEKLKMTREILGRNRVSALMTTTRYSLKGMKQVINEYVDRGFQGIFLRALNPYGFAKQDSESLAYDIDEFLKAYREALVYIIRINMDGKYFEEFYTTLLLTRILTPFSTGFMDLQSPAGAGISGAIYDYNGDVYPSDEARMLAKMGDSAFRLGNVVTDTYMAIFGGKKLRDLTSRSIMEILPGCNSCALQVYCGSDPVRNYAEQGNVIGHRPTSQFCRKNEQILKFLLGIICENDEDVMDVFWSWITKRKLEEIRRVEL